MFTNEQQLQASLTKKLADNQAIDRSIFSKRYALSSNVANAELSDDGNSKEMQLPELSHFIIQSLTSILIILIKSAEKNDPTIVHQILTLTSQLCEQIPAKCLSTGDNLLSASLKPLTDYIYDLSFSKDSTVAKKAIKIRLGFSISQASFKHILPLLTNLIFITDDVYDVQGLFIRWNDDLTVALDDWEKQQSTDSTETDEDDTQPEPEPEPESDSESKSKSDHDVEQEKDKDTTLNQTAAASVRLTGTNETPFGIYETIAGGNSSSSTSGYGTGVIIEIETNTDDLDDTSFPYLIQYSQTNETEWANADKLRIEVAVPPPTLLSLPNVINSNEDIHSLLDTLGYFIQIDTSTTESQPLLQIKRRSVAVLCEILNEKKIVEIFMQKPYASTIAKLSIPEKNRTPPSYLRLFNRQHLEQYCLSLDNCKRSKQIVEDSDTEKEIINDEVDDSFSIWNRIPIDCEQLIVEALTTNSMIYNGWKPYTSKEDIELYKQGRIGGSDELSIMPMPRSISDSSVFEESGNKHKFKGRITPTSGNTHVSFPTFIVDNIRLTEGNWYYCIKFRTAALAQVGWATTGFMPAGDSGRGVGDDKYSWSYDGSRGTLYHQTEYRNFTSDDIRWKDDDVCGCAIEIDGENTKIKYWLNGRFLGTAFEHQCNIGTTTTKCNLLPNGRGTTYFPAVSSQATYNAADYELIFSPEDMTECPLPKGYKPLMMPKLINIENSIVAYPYSAYLVGNNVQDYFTTVRRTTASTSVLRDFVNEQHLQATFTVEDHQLRLPENSDGFPFSLDNYSTSLTISFDFEIQTETENDILLCTLGTPEMFSVRIPLMSSAGETYELVPGGSEIPITANNFQEYCTRYREYRLNEFSRQIEFIRQGLYSVVPGYYLNLFTASELEESVCGKGEIDIEILKRNTNYGGNLNENSPHIQRFWNVLSEMFNEEQKKQFLIFVWGRSTLPVQDEDFTMKFGISEYYLSSNEVDKALP
ncbi:unnamed protein product, partial [Rotaria sordida]